MALNLHTLKPTPGSKKNRKRIGRGAGSGMGETSGKGHKGQTARSGGHRKYGNEGGQMPLYRRLPKYGFTNQFRVEYQVVNVSDLESCETTEITPEVLKRFRLIRSTRKPVKLLGNGAIAKAITVKLAAFSKSAIQKVEAAGGKTEVVPC